MLDKTYFSPNGQKVIDLVKQLVTESLTNLDQSLPEKIKPVSVLLIDFQMPLKNGIQAI